MKKIIYAIVLVFVLGAFSCGGNTEHKVIITGGEADPNNNTDWIEYGLVNTLVCFIDNGEQYYNFAKSTKLLIFYRYVDGRKQYSADSKGTKRLLKNPYSKISIRNGENKDIYTRDVGHYVWCYEFMNETSLTVFFIPEL